MNALQFVQRYANIMFTCDTDELETLSHFKYKTLDFSCLSRLLAVHQQRHKMLALGNMLATSQNDKRLINSIYALAVGITLLDDCAGEVLVPVDPQLAHQSDAIVSAVLPIIQHVNSDMLTQRLCVMIPATWNGIQAAEVLEQHGVRTCLTMVFSLVQAIASANAGCCMVAPSVGAICRWYANAGIDHGTRQRGVEMVETIYKYFKHYHHETKIIAFADEVKQAIALAGVADLGVDEALLTRLQHVELESDKQPCVISGSEHVHAKINVDYKLFSSVLEQDAMFETLLLQALERQARAVKAFKTQLTQLGGYMMRKAS